MKTPAKPRPPGATDILLIVTVAALVILPLPVLLEPDERILGKVVVLAALFIPPALLLGWAQRRFGPRRQTDLPGLSRIDRG